MDGENVLIATLSQGLELLHAASNSDTNLSRNGGKIDYTKIEGY
jgi:hypothetical protein